MFSDSPTLDDFDRCAQKILKQVSWYGHLRRHRREWLEKLGSTAIYGGASINPEMSSQPNAVMTKYLRRFSLFTWGETSPSNVSSAASHVSVPWVIASASAKRPFLSFSTIMLRSCNNLQVCIR